MTRATVQTATLTMARFSSVGDSSHMGMQMIHVNLLVIEVRALSTVICPAVRTWERHHRHIMDYTAAAVYESSIETKCVILMRIARE